MYSKCMHTRTSSHRAPVSALRPITRHALFRTREKKLTAAAAAPSFDTMDGASRDLAQAWNRLRDSFTPTASTTEGEDCGDYGYRKHWWRSAGASPSLLSDRLEDWEATWWEATDSRGLAELGAHKRGADGIGLWEESWAEKMFLDAATGQTIIERHARKMYSAIGGQAAWEEEWSEKYLATGPTSKWARKWAREGCESWNEKWGEEFDGHGGVLKWTDKWAERHVEDGRTIKWGDKWEERFAQREGTGSRHGEAWREGEWGERYARHWSEEWTHVEGGKGRVRKTGHSTTGESWDSVTDDAVAYEVMPHFGFGEAIHHSPQLQALRGKARGIRVDADLLE